MNIHKLQLGFFIALIALAIVLNFFVFLPYITILFLAGVLAIVFQPLYSVVLYSLGGRAALASLLCILLVLIFILAPLTFFGMLLFQESSGLYQSIASGDNGIVSFLDRAAHNVERVVHDLFPQMSFDLRSRLDMQSYASAIVVWLSQHLAVFFSGVLKGLIGFFLMIIALFYFFKDGRRFIASLKELSPLFDVHDNAIIRRLGSAVNSVIRGQVAIALIQGILTGIGFAIFGIPNPVLWGSFAAVASLLPTLGTSLVIAPAVLFLFFTGDLFGAVGLLVWGVCAVGLIDNFLGPILIKRGMKIHPFIILISVLGGIALFGPVGFIAGPVALALLFALLEVYPTIMKQPQ
jgi:predicted PurR-regulated permease PerM